MSKLIMVLWVMAMLALAACGTAGPTAAPTNAPVTDATEEAGDADAESASGGPVDAVRTFLQATYDGDTDAVASMYCAAIPTDSMPPSATQTEGVEYDLSGLTFTVENETADSADVTVGGTLTLNMDVAGTVTSSSVDYTAVTYNLVNEDGWKICPGS
jgi:predicted small lipoprotein YifL